MRPPSLICQTSKKHKCVCILWPSPLHNIKHTEPLLFRTLLLGFSFFLKQMLVISPVSLFLWASPFLWGSFDYVSPPFSWQCVCVCAPYWYSSLFHFPLEKLPSFDGPGKTTKREALTLTRFLFSLSISSSSYSVLSFSCLFPLHLSLNFFSYSFFSVCILRSFL